MVQVSTAVAAVRDAVRRHPWWTDSLLALALTAISVGSVVVARTRYGFAFPVLAAVAALFTTVPIALRRYWPLRVLAITVIAETLLLIFSSDSPVPLGVIVALYTVAARCERRVSIRAGAWVALPITVGVIANNGPHAGRVIPELAVFAIAWVVGDNLRTRRAYLAELEARSNTDRTKNRYKTTYCYIFERGEFRQQVMKLIDETDLDAPDPGALNIGERRRRHSVDIDFAGARMFEETGNVEQRRFAGARRRNQRHRLSRPYRKLGVLENIKPLVSLAEMTAHAMQEEKRLFLVVR